MMSSLKETCLGHAREDQVGPARGVLEKGPLRKEEGDWGLPVRKCLHRGRGSALLRCGGGGESQQMGQGQDSTWRPWECMVGGG